MVASFWRRGFDASKARERRTPRRSSCSTATKRWCAPAPSAGTTRWRVNLDRLRGHGDQASPAVGTDRQAGTTVDPMGRAPATSPTRPPTSPLPAARPRHPSRPHWTCRRRRARSTWRSVEDDEVAQPRQRRGGDLAAPVRPRRRRSASSTAPPHWSAPSAACSRTVTRVFVHGEAETVMSTCAVSSPRARCAAPTSISGYWRRPHRRVSAPSAARRGGTTAP